MHARCCAWTSDHTLPDYASNLYTTGVRHGEVRALQRTHIWGYGLQNMRQNMDLARPPIRRPRCVACHRVTQMLCMSTHKVRVTELKYVVLCRFIKLLGNWGGACASSSKQQASSKQLAQQGPFWAPEQQGSGIKKKLPRYLGWFPATFLGTTFFSVGPPRGQKR